MTATNNPMLRAALDYAKLGYAVLPLYSVKDGHCDCYKGKDCPTPSKHPRTEHGAKDATADEATIKQWWGMWPDANVGIAIPVGLVVLDVDPRNGGSLDSLGTLPETPTARTGGSGWHKWFKVPAGVTVKKLPGVDVRMGGKGYVVAPPSVTTGQYEWLTPLSEDVATLPEHLTSVSERAVGTGQVVQGTSLPAFWVQRAVSTAQVGNRHDTGLWLAIQLRANCFPHDVASAEPPMLEYQASVPQSADNLYTIDEALRTLRSVYASDAYLLPPAQCVSPDQISAPFCEVKEENEAKGRERDTHIHGMLPGEGRDWQLLDIEDETYRGYMAETRDEVDCFPHDGHVWENGSNAQRRNRSEQYQIREAHHYLFPEAELLSAAELSEALNIVRRHAGVGQEGFIVLDKMWRGVDGHQRGSPDKPVKTPRAWLLTILRNVYEPAPSKQEKIARNREQKQEQEARDRQRYNTLMSLGETMPTMAWDTVGSFHGRSDGDWEAYVAERAKEFAETKARKPSLDIPF